MPEQEGAQSEKKRRVSKVSNEPEIRVGTSSLAGDGNQLQQHTDDSQSVPKDMEVQPSEPKDDGTTANELQNLEPAQRVINVMMAELLKATASDIPGELFC